MAILFTTEKNCLPDFFETISADDIQDYCESKVYHRGLEYYNDGSVTEATYYSGGNSLIAIVKGTFKYTVNINLQNGEVSSSCTCPYKDGICKHTIATLLYAIDEDVEIEIIPDTKNSANETKQYMQSLSKDELISLVMKFAPEQFFVEVKNKFSDSSVAQNVFKKVERNIQKIFKDDDLLYNPNDFEEALENEIKKLSGLEKHLKDEIEGLLFYILSEVDQAFNNGCLYDHYNDYNYAPSDEFDEFVTNYVQSLNYQQKTDFLAGLDTVLKEQEYSTFESLNHLSGTVFTGNDLPSLKDMLISDYCKLSHTLVENYYEKVRMLLTNSEKENILTEIQNNSSKWLIELANIYESQNEIKKSVNVIKTWLTNHDNNYGDEKVYVLYLDLLKKDQLDLANAAKEAIFHCPTCSMLQKIASLVNNGLSDYESILEQKNAGHMLEYLETKGRLSEALALIKRSKGIWDTQVCNFFKKNKKDFPIDAEKYFSGLVDKNLEYTGENYYHAIADAIQQLKQINRSLADAYINDIRINYKRRRNLISILSKF